MRPIKFRAWHTKQNKMYSAEEMAEDQLTLLTTGYFINVAENLRLSQIDYDRVMIPLQFTGLFDKNGKDIYEGDIVKYKYACSNDFFGKIYFKNGSFCLNDAYIDDVNTDLEIVGNIYENPDLLNTGGN